MSAVGYAAHGRTALKGHVALKVHELASLKFSAPVGHKLKKRANLPILNFIFWCADAGT